MPYTVDDAPDVVRRIEEDLALVVENTRRGDPHLRSLVLTGGFARGEGAMLHDRPRNDYDLVAVRGLGRPLQSYDRIRRTLEDLLGLHIDLAPVPAWRLPFAAPSIFWYETAARGKVLWGQDVLDRIPARTATEIHPHEGLRLLVNRAAGLLLCTDQDADAKRIQASKALLAALDAHLLALGAFAPSQTERWHQYLALRASNEEAGSDPSHAWIDWAYRFKVDPAGAPDRSANQAWRTAARAVLKAVPTALRHARLAGIEDYTRRDPLLDRLAYLQRSGSVAGARRLVPNPTGRVRQATLQLLEASRDGTVRPEELQRCLQGLVRPGSPTTLATLDALRTVTLQ